jgi:hypothetical protein
MQLRYTHLMKTATLPAVRVEAALREEVEGLLREGESLSEFVEQSVRAAVQRRIHQDEFIARGLASLEAAHRSNRYIDAEVVIEGLQRKLDVAKGKAKIKAKARR